MTESQGSAVLERAWLSLDETVAALGKSPSTVERMTANERLRSKLEPRAGRKPERLYSAEDVQKLKAAAGTPRPALVPARAERPPMALAIAPETRDLARDIIAQFLAPRPVPVTEKLWLTLEEAAEYSGLSRSYLRDSCVNSDFFKPGVNLIGIRGGPHKALRIQRASLEAFAG